MSSSDEDPPSSLLEVRPSAPELASISPSPASKAARTSSPMVSQVIETNTLRRTFSGDAQMSARDLSLDRYSETISSDTDVTHTISRKVTQRMKS